MNEFHPLAYIKKHAIALMVFFCLMTAGLYMLLSFLQTYTAQVVIEYVYDGADQGLAPDGTELDLSEIYSSAVISRVLDNLDLDQAEHPIDAIRSSITVEQVEDEQVETVNTALNEDGESSDLQSTEYKVSYAVNWKDGKQLQEMAQAVLDEILDVYFTQFSEEYINQSTIADSISGLNQTGYDYIEQVELIEKALNDTIAQLTQRADIAPEFYSTKTGYSYNDLVEQVRLLNESQITPLLAYILNHQVTRDRDALLAKYEQRVKEHKFNQERSNIRIEEVENILDAYVEKLRVSNNTAQSEVITDDGTGLRGGNVVGHVEYPTYLAENGVWRPFDQTTEYEMLLQSWIDLSNSYDSSIVDEAYCQYVLNCFRGENADIETYQRDAAAVTQREGKTIEVQSESSEDQSNSLAYQKGINVVSTEKMQRLLTGDADIYVELPQAMTKEDVDYVEEHIDSILNQMSGLYGQIEATGVEFNDYVGAEYIKMVSSNHVIEKMNVILYTAVGAVLFLVLGCSGVILLSRVGDMVEYVAYTDHRLHMPNRVACDRYIDSYKERILPSGFGCMYCQILNQNEINRKLGRDTGDEVLQIFAAGLRNICSRSNGFGGYNGSGQFMAFLQNTSAATMKKAVTDFQIYLSERLSDKQVALSYAVGTAESLADNQYHIRSLLTQAIGRKVAYETGTNGSGRSGEDEK